MSGSPVIRFRLKPDLVTLLEERGSSASAVAKQIVVDELKRMPLRREHIEAVNETEEEKIELRVPQEEDPITTVGEKSGKIDVERPSPFIGAIIAHTPAPVPPDVTPAPVVHRSQVPTSEAVENHRDEWRKLMREDPGAALEIKTYEEFLKRRRDG